MVPFEFGGWISVKMFLILIGLRKRNGEISETTAAAFVLFLSNSAALKGIAKWDHFYSIGFRFRNLEEEREGKR